MDGTRQLQGRFVLPGPAGPPPDVLTEEALRAIRALRARLIHQWEALPAGKTLRVTFPAESAAAAG